MRKGALSVRTAAMIILGLMTVATIYLAVTGWFDSLISGFVGGVEFPEP
jgi:hypothetical protein